MIDDPSSLTRHHARAIVVGAGIGGLFAARVLADHFPEVLVVERDTLPATPTFRPGVPQAHHVHNLLVRGMRIGEQLFDGFARDLLAAGAVRFEWPADFLWLSPAGWAGRSRSDLVTVACSRELLEWVVRQRLAARAHVRCMDRTEVLGLLTSAAAPDRRVVGVRVRRRPSRSDALQREEHLAADLVVDASGRDSRASRWLADAGYPQPRVETVNSFAGYASRLYARPPLLTREWVVLGVQSRPPAHPRAGVINSLEGDRWLVTLAGAARDYPPTDEPGFLAFARSLPTPLLAEAIQDARPLSPIFGYQRLENRWRRFDELAAWPERFVVLGDAVCTFNPLYAQGMTISAQAALTLQRELHAQRARRLDGDLDGLAARFQRALARELRTPWLMATGEDFRYPATEGRRPLSTRLSHAYLDRVMRVAAADTAVHHAFLEVMHLLRPPMTLLRPPIAARLLRPSRGGQPIDNPTPPPGHVRTEATGMAAASSGP